MDEVIRSMSGPQLTGFVAMVLAISGAVLLAGAGLVIPLWMWTRRVESRVQLARDLVANGYSADEIERVVQLSATSQRTRKHIVQTTEVHE